MYSDVIILNFQPYKLVYAALLTDLGFNEEALDYLDIIEDTLHRIDKKTIESTLTSSFLSQHGNLQARLRTILKGSARKPKTLDGAKKVFGSLLKGMSDFFIGSETNSATETKSSASAGTVSDFKPLQETTRPVSPPESISAENRDASRTLSPPESVLVFLVLVLTSYRRNLQENLE